LKSLLSSPDDNKLTRHLTDIVALPCDEIERRLFILLNGNFNGALGNAQLLSVQQIWLRMISNIGIVTSCF